MNTVTLWHQAVLFLHLIAFAIALSAVLRADVELLLARRLDTDRLMTTARLLAVALAILWVSGAALLFIDIGPDWRAWFGGAKTGAKLLVVTALTANGMALHHFVFPRLKRPWLHTTSGATLPLVLGAISTASWLFASFVGVSRLIAPSMRFVDYLSLYALVLALAVGGALVFMRRRVERLMLANGLT